jgi:hypothetical protein
MTSAGSEEGWSLLRGAAATSPSVTPQTLNPIPAVQRSVGNQQHVAAGLRDLLNLGRVTGKAAGALLEKGFGKVVSASIATSTGPLIPVPTWDADIQAYIRYNAADGAKIQAGRSRSPRWHQDGLILSMQPRAGAMTLGMDIFVRNGHWNEWTYVHELVHVAQYRAGTVTFLISYFGLAAKKIVKRFLAGSPLDPFTASPYEKEAYGVQNRFMEWLRAGKPGPCS